MLTQFDMLIQLIENIENGETLIETFLVQNGYIPYYHKHCNEGDILKYRLYRGNLE